MSGRISRRTALGLMGVGSAAGVGVLTACSPSDQAAHPAASAAEPTVASWSASRGPHYYIAHRGSGDVFPEHSMEAYRAALGWGAECMEISVGMTSDGVLICMHDDTYDRTTTTTGSLEAMPSTILRSVRLDQPQLGPAWSADPVPMVPLFEEALKAFGGRVVLALEAKNDAAYPAVMELVEGYGLQSSVIVKAYHTSSRITEAKAAGYPVFGYLGAEADLTAANISNLAGKLKGATDCLVIPAYGSNGFVSDSSVKLAVASGIPVWVFPVHRRSDAAHFFSLGVAGIVTASFGYVSTSVPIATADTWKYGAVAPGEMTKSPDVVAYSPQWTSGDLVLAAKNTQHFVTMGHLSPLTNAAKSYSVQFEAQWTTLPADLTSSVVLAFGHADDAYYELRAGSGSGYHVILRANGQFSLFLHSEGTTAGNQLSNVQTPVPELGQWFKISIQVTPDKIIATRSDVDGSSISSSDRSFRGGYLHIGRSSTDGAAAFRNLRVG